MQSSVYSLVSQLPNQDQRQHQGHSFHDPQPDPTETYFKHVKASCEICQLEGSIKMLS